MKHAGWLAVGSVCAGAGTVLAGMSLMGTSGYLISRAAERPPILDLMLVFAAVRLFGLARPALRYLERLASHELTFRVLRAVRAWFVGALLPLSQGQLAMFRSGDLLSRLASDVDALQESYLRVVAPAAVAVVVSVSVVAGFALVDLRIAAVVFLFLVAHGGGWSWLAFRQARDMGHRRNQARRTFSADLVATFQGLDDVLTCGWEGRAHAHAAEVQGRLAAMERRDGRTLALHAAAGTIATLTAAWCVLVLALDAVAADQLAPVWIAPLMLATIAAFEAVEGLPAAWQFAGQTRDSARRVLEVVHTQPVRDTARRACPATTAPSLEFDRVSFGYGASRVLEDVSLRIRPGEHVAVAGATGAGKSTLLALLMRSWDPEAGVVRVNDIDLRDIGLADLRAHTAVLPQQVHVFNETLRENVRLARRRATDATLVDVLSRAGLADFVARAPRGLDTPLGEHGARMSAGERQRLGLARILLTEATLVLADEPTANLDARCERELLATLCDWARNRTLVLVSHRRAALAHADRVLTVADGRITEIPASASHARASH